MPFANHLDPASAAIHFEPEGYSTSGSRLMGRQAAGAAFLRAFAQSESSAVAWCHGSTDEGTKAFTAQMQSYGFGGRVQSVSASCHERLATPGCLYYPSPTLAEVAWRRFGSDDRLYSLCGVTHTTASHAVMTAITQLMTAPLRSWDAVVCTSRVVRDSVRTQLEAQADYLAWRVGATRFELPQLPLIPLGVHVDDFSYVPSLRAAAREQLAIPADARVALFVGRLSFHAKAHPQAMYLALESAAQRSGRSVHLVQCGWFANEHIEAAFRDAAKLLAPSVTTHFLDGREEAQRRTAWACADFFVSLSDNVQETFGLTPIEAMAAGLPVVVSDWNGYRDTVRDGIDGFRIPTLMPAAPLGEDLAQRYADSIDSYDIYCGHVCELVAVDVKAASDAVLRLIQNDELRLQMSSAAQAQVRAQFEWRHVIAQYRSLWAELAERRRADARLLPRLERRVRPDRMDPFALFESYATASLSEQDRLHLRADADAQMLTQYRKLAINRFARYVFPSEQECADVLARLAAHGVHSVQEMLAHFPVDRRAYLMRGLVWMMKMNVLHIEAASRQGQS